MSQRKYCDRSLSVCKIVWPRQVTMKSLQKRLPMITFACFETQFRGIVLIVRQSTEKVNWADNCNSLTWREQRQKREIWLLQQSDNGG